jgi:hypothetical protein
MILQEVVTLLQSLPPGAAGIEQVEAVVARWSQRWPSVQQPTADACLTVIHVRGLLLDALMQEWPRDQQHQGQTVYQVCAHRSIAHAVISLAIKTQHTSTHAELLWQYQAAALSHLKFGD